MNVRNNYSDRMTTSSSSSIEQLAYPSVAQTHNQSPPNDEHNHHHQRHQSFYDNLYRKDVENATFMIHRMIRSCEWDKINVLWCRGMLPYSVWTLPNGIGWTSLHFAAITSSNIPIHHWSFLIQTILYSTNQSRQTYQPPPPSTINASTIGSEWNNIPISESQSISSNNSDNQTSFTASTATISDSRKIITTDITLGQSVTPSSSKSTPSSSPTYQVLEMKSLKTSSPFWMTTDSGHSPIDLFFHHHLCPYQWQKPELNTNAIQLQQAINDILSNPKKIYSLKLRIESNYHHHTKNIEDTEEESLKKRRRTPKQYYDEDDIVTLCKNLDAVEVFWYRMEVLLMACCDYNRTYYDDLHTENKKWRVLHALAHTDCPKPISQLVLALYPNQVKERDENGNLPLHIASKFTKHSSFFSYHNDSLNKSDYCNPTQENDALHVTDEEENDRQYQSHDSPISTYCHYSIMTELLKAYPDASICPDGAGQIPLTIALEAGKSWDNGIQDLFLAAPQVVTNKFTPNGSVPSSLSFYPFQLAATKRSENDDEEEKNRKAKQYAFFQLGHLWTFLPQSSKDKAIQDGLNYIDNMKLNTVHELLLAAPNVVSLLLLEDQQN